MLVVGYSFCVRIDEKGGEKVEDKVRDAFSYYDIPYKELMENDVPKDEVVNSVVVKTAKSRHGRNGIVALDDRTCLAYHLTNNLKCVTEIDWEMIDKYYKEKAVIRPLLGIDLPIGIIPMQEFHFFSMALVYLDADVMFKFISRRGGPPEGMLYG